MRKFREQVGPWRRAALRNHREKEFRHLVCCRFGDVVFFRRGARTPDEKRHVVRHPLHAREFVARHTEHVHDHERRQRAGKFGDEIEFRALADLLEQPGGQALDVRAHVAHRFEVEDLARKPAQAGVFRCIAKHHPQGQVANDVADLLRLGARHRSEERPQPVGRHLAVQANPLHVGIAGQDPGLDARAPVGRILILHAAHQRERVGQKCRLVGLVVNRHASDSSLRARRRSRPAPCPSRLAQYRFRRTSAPPISRWWAARGTSGLQHWWRRPAG